jgi:hypothetical protein
MEWLKITYKEINHFAWEIEKWDSNVKINDNFLPYSHNKPETYIYWKQVWGEVIIGWTPVYLADIWNLLYWYLWNRANFSYNHIKNNVANATKIKVWLNSEKVEKNEKDDRVLYK